MKGESFEKGSIDRWFGTTSINALYLGNTSVKSSRWVEFRGITFKRIAFGLEAHVGRQKHSGMTKRYNSVVEMNIDTEAWLPGFKSSLPLTNCVILGNLPNLYVLQFFIYM